MHLAQGEREAESVKEKKIKRKEQQVIPDAEFQKMSRELNEAIKFDLRWFFLLLYRALWLEQTFEFLQGKFEQNGFNVAKFAKWGENCAI